MKEFFEILNSINPLSAELQQHLIQTLIPRLYIRKNFYLKKVRYVRVFFL